MKKALIRIGALALALAVLAGLTPGLMHSRASAQGAGFLHGIVKDEQGVPMAGLTIVCVPQGGSGGEITLTTDKDGKFTKAIPVGTYTLIYRQGDKDLFKNAVRIVAGQDTPMNLNMSDPKVAEYVARVKKQQENEEKFGKLKTHFDAGTAALTEEESLRGQLNKAPNDQRADLQAKLDPVASTAINEFQQALAATDATDGKNRTAIFNQMGAAFDAAGRYEEAADAYKQAIAIRPDAGAYNNFGNDLAKAGKFDEAKAAYEKSAELDPAGAALAYRNFGAILYTAGKLQGSPAAELLQKSTELDPKNAQTWFLLGAALAANMQVKQEGEKMIFVLLPGTIEAYQKCIDLDPSGPFSASAKQGIEELKAMGLGIDTKVTAPKVKH